MKLFVGLGNPGSEYAGNRHNVGFMAVDQIARAHRFGPWKRKFQGHAADGEIAGEKVLLLKPDTYMNESGRSVGEAARFLKIPEADIVVFYDEIDLGPSKLKVKTGGGNAGHNGLRSISAHLGNDYVRVRIGVGHPGTKELVARWVLSDFAKADQAWLEPLLDAIAKAAPRLLKDDQSRFLTDVAKDLGEAPDPRKDRAKEKKEAAAETPPRPAPKPRSHPAGERAGKSANALAENLKKWLAGRKPSE
ncbi:aminoacyl-tRNA hydrolase [Hyphomicrobium sp. LHD-15]|uniref:aminoacyl-tRNA hydrolase n=1 Tax=Hyphomicrobium sp. LHD-15 TaxID=3072142 RepID=UPI00280F332E|nr:aminoacyl-tRNA hydrolase [Hyphomicrobium sp. LHD-15]MDQ8698379.1 aminoacyl-tRNA hydrolase [Hyphomicrobium sp. LHD-15]